MKRRLPLKILPETEVRENPYVRDLEDRLSDIWMLQFLNRKNKGKIEIRTVRWTNWTGFFLLSVLTDRGMNLSTTRLTKRLKIFDTALFCNTYLLLVLIFKGIQGAARLERYVQSDRDGRYRICHVVTFYWVGLTG